MAFICLVVDDLSLFAYSALIFLVLKEFVPLRFKNRILHLAEILCLMLGCNAIVYPEEVTGTVGSLLMLLPILFLFHKSEWYMKVTTAFIVYPAMMALAFLFQDMGQQIWENVFHQQMSDAGENALYVFPGGADADKADVVRPVSDLAFLFYRDHHYHIPVFGEGILSGVALVHCHSGHQHGVLLSLHLYGEDCAVRHGKGDHAVSEVLLSGD